MHTGLIYLNHTHGKGDALMDAASAVNKTT
nr:MAG TPA: hypothetical protein [Caudoviricetes sp.]